VLARASRYLPIYGDVWRLAFPVILTNLLMSLVNIVDLFMVGRIGPVEIAAVGMANSVRMLVMITILAVTAGAMTLAAQAKGARDPAQLSFVTRQTLSLTVLLGALLTVLGYFASEPLLAFLNSGGDPQAVTLGTGYLQLLFLGTIFLVINFSVSSLMQGAGDTVTPLYLSGSINLLNILFNYLFIFGPGPFPELGVTGAALGTVLSRALGAGLGVALFYSGRNVIALLPGSYRPDWAMFRDLLAIGVPSGLQGLVRNSAQLLVIRIVTSTAAGTYGAAALAIGLQIESLAFMPGLAISVAATSLVGQSLGAWQVEEARSRGNAAIGLGVIVMSILGLPLILFAPQLVRLFDPSAHPTVLAAGVSYLRINALGLPILAVAMVVNGALRGAGDTRPGLVGNLLGRWLTAVPLAYALALTLGLGVAGVWLALVIGTAISALWVLWRWRSRAWLGVALRKTQLYRLHLARQPREVRRAYLNEVRGPLMAEPEARERVDEAGVTYAVTAGEVRVVFGEEGYHVLEPLSPRRRAASSD
jgi:putative MATE family efflux protein